MEPTSIKKFFDPTPRLKSSPIPIFFVPFDIEEKVCDCGHIYSITCYSQKYCKNCLFKYIKDVPDFRIYLIICNIYLNTFNVKEFEKWSENISYKQIVTNQSLCKSVKVDCELCGHKHYGIICPICNLISFEFIESNSAAAILHLPWWDACNQCIICDSKLESSTDSQKWCSNCLIVYTGCRYCLTTNIIFGMAEQSQCMKCKRIFLVNVNMPANITNNGEYILLKLNTHNFNQISNYVDNIDKNSNLLELYGFMKKLNYFNLKIYSQIEYNENYLEITIPIMFIPFNNDDEYVCFCCKAVYSKTILSKKKYCHNCLCWCIKHSISGSNIRCAINNLDIYINTTINNCDKHEPKILDFCNESWCENCSKILCFKQIVTDDFRNINYSYYEKNCRLCGKLIYNQLCSDCYSMSFEIIESNSTAPILHLPWWDAFGECIICDLKLKFSSSSQKLCSNCLIVYTGCRYCLTTNIIFGMTEQSQCMKCKRITTVTINTINITNITGNNNINEFLYITRNHNDNHNYHHQFVNYISANKSLFNPLDVYSFFKNFVFHSLDPKWFPYSKITNLTKIAEGGYGKIYKASIYGNIVAIKEFLNSQDPSKYFLNEIKSLYQCYDDKFEYIIKCHGITKNPMTEEFMFIMKYANGGDLHNYLQENFTRITWKKKLYILWRISDGFIHRDFHSGNILVEIIENELCSIDQYLIGDLGLSQPANNTLTNNEIYGVIPYIAPEIFKGVAFTKASDIYSMGMIMWELTTGCKPFANVEHDVDLIYKITDGKRPEITDDTPEDFVNLMKKCWNSDPKKRPSAKQVCEKFNLWSTLEKNADHIDKFNQAEEIRLELIRTKSIGPEFNEKPHSKSIYKSRSLSSIISEYSSTNSSMNSLRQKFVTREYDLDINNIQSDSIIQNSLSELISEINLSGKQNIGNEAQTSIEENRFEYATREYEFDINDINVNQGQVQSPST
ncbi:hypothetical protein RclHR1_03820014 [Rhizophagus clarus]|uniref:Protein kinase domain-containing protein n=1 Tax=Rhizophagus clarus TaxID=94130 RepID=A0A2Z6S7X3_9GLOM|nr:hypothetical protein RclHR1_03820014 [Rhizophagus clarus]